LLGDGANAIPKPQPRELRQNPALRHRPTTAVAKAPAVTARPVPCSNKRGRRAISSLHSARLQDPRNGRRCTPAKPPVAPHTAFSFRVCFALLSVDALKVAVPALLSVSVPRCRAAVVQAWSNSCRRSYGRRHVTSCPHVGRGSEPNRARSLLQLFPPSGSKRPRCCWQIEHLRHSRTP